MSNFFRCILALVVAFALVSGAMAADQQPSKPTEKSNTALLSDLDLKDFSADSLESLLRQNEQKAASRSTKVEQEERNKNLNELIEMLRSKKSATK